jgi:hypothetical protein
MEAKKMGRIILAAAFVMSLCCVFAKAHAEDKVLFGFEKDTEGWEIPDWALEKEDYVGKDAAVDTKVADEGKQSLKIDTKFPGGKWTAAYIEIQQYFDWTPYKAVSVDVYLPEGAPVGLKSKMIATIGESWNWVEMAKGTALEPGKWTTITANLLEGSTDFRAKVDDAFRKDIRKIGVRIESNMKPVYEGPIYIDNLRLIEK